eukprot:2252157-Amphidinium_carterae.1
MLPNTYQKIAQYCKVLLKEHKGLLNTEYSKGIPKLPKQQSKYHYCKKAYYRGLLKTEGEY